MQLLTMPRAPQTSPLFRTARPSQQPTVMRPAYSYRPVPQRPAVACVAAPAAVDPDLPRDVASRFGRRVRELRQAHSMTQVEVAVHFGIDRTFISDVERGRKSVCLPTMEVFALGFGLSLSDLLRGI